MSSLSAVGISIRSYFKVRTQVGREASGWHRTNSCLGYPCRQRCRSCQTQAGEIVRAVWLQCHHGDAKRLSLDLTGAGRNGFTVLVYAVSQMWADWGEFNHPSTVLYKWNWNLATPIVYTVWLCVQLCSAKTGSWITVTETIWPYTHKIFTLAIYIKFGQHLL